MESEQLPAQCSNVLSPNLARLGKAHTSGHLHVEAVATNGSLGSNVQNGLSYSVPISGAPVALGRSATCYSARSGNQAAAQLGARGRNAAVVGPKSQSMHGRWRKSFIGFIDSAGNRGGKKKSRESSRLGRLTEHVEPGLLRGVQTDKVLGQLGAIWDNRMHSTSAEALTEDQERDFMLSEPVDLLNDFISHDWATGRWVKFLALCHCYNSIASVAISVLGCALLAVPLLHGILPRPGRVPSKQIICGREVAVDVAFLFQPVGFVLFWITFLFWQKAKRLCRCRPRFAFVDKVCIQQSDEQLKRRGILSLAGFLARSDRLVMLWTTRYFTRLWCVYEVATWLHIAGQNNFRRGIKFMPLSRALVFTVIQLVFFLYYWMLTSFRMLGFPAYIAMPPCTFLASFPLIFGVQASFRDLLNLPGQLRAFSIKDAACFCCSHGHRHPVTGEVLPCDRKLIYTALNGWFGQSSSGIRLDTEEQVLEYFDELVRKRVRRGIVARFGLIHVGFREAMLMTLPTMFYELECVFALILSPEVPADIIERQLVYSFSKCLFWWPILLKLSIYYISNVSKLVTRFVGSSRTYGIVGPILATVWTLMCGILYLPLWSAAATSSPAPLWCVMGALALGTGLLYGPAPSLTGSTQEEEVSFDESASLEATSRNAATEVGSSGRDEKPRWIQDATKSSLGESLGGSVGRRPASGAVLTLQPSAMGVGSSAQTLGTSLALTDVDSNQAADDEGKCTVKTASEAEPPRCTRKSMEDSYRWLGMKTACTNFSDVEIVL